MNYLIDSARKLLLDRHGPLTRQLVREPGGFGLGQVPSRLKPDKTTTAVCGFCSTGCGLDIHIKGEKPVNLSPSRDYSVNQGMACPKGWEALSPLSGPDRATQPLLRDEAGRLNPVSWEEALAHFVQGVRGVQERHGPESFAFLSTGQIATEEMALLGMVAKFGMGMVHGDGNTRQCMATAATAYKQSFGFDAPPFSYADFEESDVLVFVGANPCIAHPIMWERVCLNRHEPKIVVVDPRRTETAMAATHHLAPAPKSDLVLFYGIAKILDDEGWVNQDFIQNSTSGFEEFRDFLGAFSLKRVTASTGLMAEQVMDLARLIHEGKRVSFWWTMGVNQSHEGVRLAQSLINLALMTGNIGRPGTGANSITGQCNAMGSRLFSNTTNLMGGHDFLSAEDRAKVARIVGVNEAHIPRQNSLAYDQIIDGIESGSIRGLWIIATNTAHSWIHQRRTKKLLDRLDFLVAQDMYHSTDTAEHAHLVLPAAGWGEKEGTFINSERRFGLLKKVSPAPGQALSDFFIFKLIADAWGGLDWASKWKRPEDVFLTLKELSRGQPCDFTGIADYQMLEELRGIQWPLPEGSSVERRSERRLFEDGRFFTDSGRASILFDEPRVVPEPTSEEFPLFLLTGRGSSSQWHTQTRTRNSPMLNRLSSADPWVEVHPDDAKRLGVKDRKWVIVSSKRGTLRARAYVTRIVSPGQVFVPMHYARTNELTFPAVDPHSRQPAYKGAAVALRPAED